LLLAESLQDVGRWDEAIEQCRIAVQLRPSDPSAHVALGRSLAYRRRWDEARVQLQQALKLDPGNVAARNTIAAVNVVEKQLGGK
jgi:Flp pilus assembly protein TadD